VGLPGGAPAQSRATRGKKRFKPFPKFKRFKNVYFFPNFDRSKFGIPALQKFEIKYSFEDIKKMNNFIYRNFFKFERDLE
jgi:hypothetical protein